MAFNRLAAGRKVYSQGSYAPTRGTVNPSGYIKRELKKKSVQKKPSQKRSGLAAKALKTVKKPAPKKPTAVKTVAPRPVSGSTLPTSTNFPIIKLNENGQLDLPYGENFGSSLLEHQEDMNKQLLDMQQAQQEQTQQYTAAKRDAAQTNTENQRSTLNRNASRGTAYSSAYGSQVAKNATEYNNYMSDLENQNTQAQAGFASGRTAVENAFNDYLRKAVLDRGVELGQQAGTLGYGQNTAKPVYAVPKSPVSKIIKKPAAPKKVIKKPAAPKKVAVKVKKR